MLIVHAHRSTQYMTVVATVHSIAKRNLCLLNQLFNTPLLTNSVWKAVILWVWVHFCMESKSRTLVAAGVVVGHLIILCCGSKAYPHKTTVCRKCNSRTRKQQECGVIQIYAWQGNSKNMGCIHSNCAWFCLWKWCGVTWSYTIHKLLPWLQTSCRNNSWRICFVIIHKLQRYNQ